jgi:hypothetical protein
MKVLKTGSRLLWPLLCSNTTIALPFRFAHLFRMIIRPDGYNNNNRSAIVLRLEQNDFPMRESRQRIAALTM